MKRLVLAISVIAAMIFPTGVSAQETEEFKPSGKITGLFFADYHNTFSEGENVSVFEVTRSYFGYDYSFSKTISGRIMYDATAQAFGGKTIMMAYLRNAYIQYDNGKLLVRGGLLGVEQISMTDKFWNYRYVARPAIDLWGMIPTVDMGIMAKYKPSDLVAIDLGILNGRGHKDVTPDTTLKMVSGVTFMPSEKLMFRAYYDLMGPSGRMHQTFSITGAYISKTFTLGAEYLMQKNHLMSAGNDYSGYCIFTSYRFMEKFTLFGRYDDISSVIADGDTEPWNIANDGSLFILGFDYTPSKNVRLSPNFTGIVPDDQGKSFTGMAGLNVELRF